MDGVDRYALAVQADDLLDRFDGQTADDGAFQIAGDLKHVTAARLIVQCRI